MSDLIRFALTQRLLLLVMTALMAVAGYFAALALPIDAFPDVSPTQVKIIIKAPGMTPEEVESRITAPIELSLLGIPRQTMLRSIAKYAVTDITVDFEEGTDIYWARQQIAERLNGVWAELPDGIDGGVAPMTTPLGEMFMFTIEGDLPLMEKRNLLDWVIRPVLRNVPGVADVNVLGGMVRSFEVIPDHLRLASRGIALQDLKAALLSNNRNDGAGRVAEGEEALLVRSEGRIKNLDDLSAIVVAERDGVPIRVGDVAEVRIGALTRYGAVTQSRGLEAGGMRLGAEEQKMEPNHQASSPQSPAANPSEAVEGLVLSLRGANARQVIAGLEQKLEELKPVLPKGVELSPFYNRSDLVGRAVHTVVKALIEAVALVIVLLMLFLGDVRAALTVALSLPLAALWTFILMRQFGLTANLMSLGGLAIAIGMLVDGAVVVVENIATRMADQDAAAKLPGLHVIYRAVKEVSVPVTSGILIIIIVFLPLLSLEGLEGKLFAPVALTIVFALTGALLMSMTVIPVLASFLLKHPEHEDPWLPRKLNAAYRPILLWCLSHVATVVKIAGGLLLVTVLLFSQIGKTFMPTLDEGDIIVQVEKLPSITLEQSARLDVQIQKAILQAVPEVTRITARLGSDELGLDPMGLNETDTFMVLKPREEWRMNDKDALIDEIRKVMDDFPGIAYGFTQPIQMRVTEMLTGVRGDVAVKLYGPELAVLNAKAEEIAAALRKVPGASDVFTTRNSGMQYLQLNVDRLAAGRLGLTGDQLQEALRAGIEGLQLGIVQEGIQRTPLILRGPGDMNTLAALQVALPDGRKTALSSIAKLERVEGVVAVGREQGQRFAVVRSNVQDRDLVGFVEEARSVVNKAVPLPSGYYLRWGGQFENQQRAAARLGLVVPVAIGLIFLLLFSTFRSVRQAVLVLSNIPLAMIGGVVGLWISGEYLSVPASVGFIALLGIAVLNGVVLVSYFNQLRAQGMDMGRVVVEGTMRRLRPVLMTAGIAAFGLVPMLFASGPGSEIQRPLAIVVIGGLVTSTALTLIFLPILYRRYGEERG
ncbi:MAG: efflux RND transporter permease subunit [Methylococcaceae bacterium]|nr:MAG: efflux RND transporter permease subunit [Methylococcaceae bacterium]